MDVSMVDESMSLSKNVLLKLPDPVRLENPFGCWGAFVAPICYGDPLRYHGYSDSRGFLYFIDGQASRFITKFHPKLNNEGLESIPRSKRSGNIPCIQSLQISSHFWMFGCGRNFQLSEERINTFVWHLKKQTWSNGPDFPLRYLSDEYEHFCMAALNESHAVVVALLPKMPGPGTHFRPTFYDPLYKVRLVNFKNNVWTYWPSFPLEEGEESHKYGCQSTVGYSSKNIRSGHFNFF